MATDQNESGAITPADIALESAPKTTRPESSSRREDADDTDVGRALNRKLDAFPDRFDIDDWPYRPHLQRLPDRLVNIDAVPLVLDQGTEGACTGFALAAVINYLLAQRRTGNQVSPRMLYEMARRYDEWPGEEYEGSSARGAMKGWQRHGVCERELWPDALHGPGHLTDDLSQQARAVPGGAYYRVDFRKVRHLHAALNEVGIVYATMMVHEGWGLTGDAIRQQIEVDGRSWTLPVIPRKRRATGGHAVAIVGYTENGFIIQNSWGKGWGAGGFALLPYEDFMMHATDVWVAQLGVPVKADLWRERGAADTLSGRHRAGEAIPMAEIRPYVINIGNNGLLDDSGDYWTAPEDLTRLFTETIPAQTAGWKKKRIMLYIHGGLNSEKDVAKRVVSFRDVCLANEIYPLHIMWESDWFRSTINLTEDMFTREDQRAAAPFKDFAREARDRVLELTLAKPGGALWREMKENALLASVGERGAMRLVADAVAGVVGSVAPGTLEQWELHVVGHSAGSIFAAASSGLLARVGVPWKTTQLMAPAITVDDYHEMLRSSVGDKCPLPIVYVLSEVGELDDDVGPYGKSLLYLVSNAFERRRGTPLLGMLKHLVDDPTLEELFASREGPTAGTLFPGVVESGTIHPSGLASQSDTHGGFDNDAPTMNSIMQVILGQPPTRLFTARDLDF